MADDGKVRGVIAIALAALTPPGLAQVATDMRQNAPAAATEAIAAPSDLRTRPAFVRGAQPETLPEVREAAKRGGFGELVLEARVTPLGTVADVKTVKSSGDAGVDSAIARLLGTWTLTAPVDKSGQKVSTIAKFPFAVGVTPQRITKGAPEVPEAAKAAFHNGLVVVSLRIDQTGTPTDVKVARSSKSNLLDDALVSFATRQRFTVPRDLSGAPVVYDTTIAHRFTQMEGDGSYIGSLKTLKCATFVGELGWWQANHPDQKVETTEFYRFMAGISFLTPEVFGWSKVPLGEISARNKRAWGGAVERCTADPKSLFLAQYRKG